MKNPQITQMTSDFSFGVQKVPRTKESAATRESVFIGKAAFWPGTKI
jgi:hypothetical protein